MIELIELQHAVLCAQCERVSASRKTCLGCGSVAILSLARILNRTEEPTMSEIENLMAMVERQMKWSPVIPTAKQIETALFEQLEYDVTARRAAAADLNERQRLEEVEHGIDQND